MPLTRSFPTRQSDHLHHHRWGQYNRTSGKIGAYSSWDFLSFSLSRRVHTLLRSVPSMPCTSVKKHITCISFINLFSPNIYFHYSMVSRSCHCNSELFSKKVFNIENISLKLMCYRYPSQTTARTTCKLARACSPISRVYPLQYCLVFCMFYKELLYFSLRFARYL